jgi:predicted DsbA family dithiol-disulfide isomerase
VAHHGRGESPASTDVLVAAAQSAGLDAARAREVLSTDEYAADVRAQEQYYTSAGIHSVPAIIFNDKHLVSGGQPVEVFEQAIRQIAAGAAG